MERYALAAFRSRQSVMRFDDALQSIGIYTQIVSTPQTISMGCGLSVRLEQDDLPLAIEIYQKQPDRNLIGFYNVLVINGRIQIIPVRV